MVVVSHDDVLGVDGADDLGHVENFRLPIIFPSRFSPEQTFIPDPESHYECNNVEH